MTGPARALSRVLTGLDPCLCAQARQLLAQASVIAEAPGVSFIPAGHGQSHGSDPTTGTGGTVHDRVAHRIAGCHTDQDLQAAIDGCRHDIAHVRRARPRPKQKFRDRILVEWEGHHYRAVAQVTNTPPTTIWTWRDRAGLNPLDGKAKAA